MTKSRNPNLSSASVSVQIPNELYEAGKQMAKEYGMTMRAFTASLICAGIKRGYSKDFLERKKEQLLAALDKVEADLEDCQE